VDWLFLKKEYSFIKFILIEKIAPPKKKKKSQNLPNFSLFFFPFCDVAEVMIIYKKPNLAINESKYFKTSFYIVGSLLGT